MLLDHETGSKVVGHRVKLLGQSGHAPNVAVLVEAHRDYAVVKPNRHRDTIRVAWKYIRYPKADNHTARANGRANAK